MNKGETRNGNKSEGDHRDENCKKSRKKTKKWEWKYEQRKTRVRGLWGGMQGWNGIKGRRNATFMTRDEKR